MIFLKLILLGHFSYGIATTFSAKGDPWNPIPYAACLRRDLRDETDIIIAHKTLPCGKRVLIYNIRTNRFAFATVGDRGPRRAMIDISSALAKKLHSNGMEKMIMIETKGR